MSESITMREALLLDIEDLKRERDEARAALAEVEQENDQLLASNKNYERDWPILVHERDEAREVAENLVEYAHECLVELESWGKGYAKYEREMETIREAIAGCEKWKEAAK